MEDLLCLYAYRKYRANHHNNTIHHHISTWLFVCHTPIINKHKRSIVNAHEIRISFLVDLLQTILPIVIPTPRINAKFAILLPRIFHNASPVYPCIAD